MGFNKGEWSEIYTFLYLLENPDIKIVNNELICIDEQIFKIIEILNDTVKYKIDINKIKKITVNGEVKEYLLSNISSNRRVLLSKILSQEASSGSFDIVDMQSLIDDFFDGKKPKGSSSEKTDLSANVIDNKISSTIKINYNIKSSLGSPATLLNASNNTNFIYKIENIDDRLMNVINSIEGRTKLLDRYKMLKENCADIKFIKTESTIFKNNLELIDSKLPEILSKLLILSYSENEKDIKILMNKLITNETEKNFYTKKIGDFANAVTFGMRAGESWNGINEVNGGIFLVRRTGDIHLLDLIYHKHFIDKYLIDNIKFDSPSSTRYKMFDIYKENNEYFTKLNIQIRFK